MDPRSEADEESVRGSLLRVLMQKDNGLLLGGVETMACLHKGLNVVSVLRYSLYVLVPTLDRVEGARLGGF